MSNRLRLRALSASMLAMLALSGCGGPQLDDVPPPPPSFMDAPPPPPPPERPWRSEAPSDLLGGPPRERDRPSYQDDDGFGTMAPIPNPEDLNDEDRRAIYGDRYEQALAREPAAPDLSRPASQARHAPRQPRHGVTRHGSAPAHHNGSRTVARPANVDHPAAAPAAAPAVTGPSSRAVAPSASAPANIDTVTEALGVAVAGDVTAGAKLDVPQAIFQGQPGVVVLTLPTSLLSRLQAEAPRLGLSDAARQIDARAILTADGYDIVPTSEQSARLKDGEATSLSWKVTPRSGAKGAFQAHVSGQLRGGRKPTPFWIAVVEKADPAIKDDEAAAAGPSAFDLPGLPLITVPGVGQVRSGTVVLLGIGLVILILLAAWARNARERRLAREREQRSRRLAEIAQSEGPSETSPATTAPPATAEASDKKEPQGV